MSVDSESAWVSRVKRVRVSSVRERGGAPPTEGVPAFSSAALGPRCFPSAPPLEVRGWGHRVHFPCPVRERRHPPHALAHTRDSYPLHSRGPRTLTLDTQTLFTLDTQTPSLSTPTHSHTQHPRALTLDAHALSLSCASSGAVSQRACTTTLHKCAVVPRRARI